MKIKNILSIAACGVLLCACSDMLDTNSNNNAGLPALDQKTDSMTYMLGIMKSVQQAADQYLITGEMRGDLVKTNEYSDKALKELATFKVSNNNKFDSAYVYYRIINNCNYFIAHRDTTLVTGIRKVAIPEYAEALAVRLWSYIQLAKNYGKVPFYTKPITTLSNNWKDYPKLDLQAICNQLLPEMSKYSGVEVLSYGNFDNTSSSISVPSSKIMMPIDVVMGDAYLETNDYTNAARCYFKYLKTYNVATSGVYCKVDKYPSELPATAQNYVNAANATEWSKTFSTSNTSELVTIIPMSLNLLGGTSTNVPYYFGYDLYAVKSANKYVQNHQIEASDKYFTLSDNQDYYYPVQNGGVVVSVGTLKIGDMRRYNEVDKATSKANESFSIINKFNIGNIPVYRTSMIYLRLAEALNRMGYPATAFAILKDGLSETNLKDNTYLTHADSTLLTNGITPFLNFENKTIFVNNRGIHSQGCGYTAGTKNNEYQMDKMVDDKLSDMESNCGYVATGAKADTINAVEDLICDEMGLELAFEGNRYGDLCRIANHKGDYGVTWLAKKLAFKFGGYDASKAYFDDKSNWYLPFK